MTRPMLRRRLIAAVLASALPLAAAEAIATPKPTSTATAQRLTNLITRGSAEIDRRIANLTTAQEKLDASTKLSAADKATLDDQVKAELAGLAALKAKLAADTTLAAARTDVQSIVTDYRVYALMLPKVRLVASVDRFDVAEEKLSTLYDQLFAKVHPNGISATEGVSAADAPLADMKAKIASAKSKTDGLTAKLLVLKPTDYNANHAVLVTYRTTMKSAQEDLKAARDDAKDILALLKK